VPWKAAGICTVRQQTHTSSLRASSQQTLHLTLAAELHRQAATAVGTAVVGGIPHGGPATPLRRFTAAAALQEQPRPTRMMSLSVEQPACCDACQGGCECGYDSSSGGESSRMAPAGLQLGCCGEKGWWLHALPISTQFPQCLGWAAHFLAGVPIRPVEGTIPCNMGGWCQQLRVRPPP
jgi:hypothetical protein